MTRVTHATVRIVGELEAHAATLSRALGLLRIATDNARKARDLELIEAIDREATYLTKQLRRVQQERAQLQAELAEM
jgi:septal ring factor EnvC (AmiA/AmiB activator)